MVAFGSALLLAPSTPLAKYLVGSVAPLALAAFAPLRVGRLVATRLRDERRPLSRGAAQDKLRCSYRAFGIVILTMFGGWSGFGLAVGGFLVLVIVRGIAEGNDHARALEDWHVSFRCGRCGTIFRIPTP